MTRRDEDQESGTYFEQIPLEEVRKAVDPEVFRKPETGTENVIFESVSDKTEPYSVRPDWLGEKRRTSIMNQRRSWRCPPRREPGELY
jgi:hypothetical protein